MVFREMLVRMRRPSVAIVADPSVVTSSENPLRINESEMDELRPKKKKKIKT